MANINDSAGIFTGTNLDRFNAMEALVGRDGDVAYAKSVIGDALLRVIQTWQDPETLAVKVRAPQ